MEKITIIENEGTTTKIILASVYLPNDDMTIIIEDTFINDVPVKTEIKGFYYGEPNEENTEIYKDKGVICTYK